jgi:hypothetical protein
MTPQPRESGNHNSIHYERALTDTMLLPYVVGSSWRTGYLWQDQQGRINKKQQQQSRSLMNDTREVRTLLGGGIVTEGVAGYPLEGYPWALSSTMGATNILVSQKDYFSYSYATLHDDISR